MNLYTYILIIALLITIILWRFEFRIRRIERNQKYHRKIMLDIAKAADIRVQYEWEKYGD